MININKTNKKTNFINQSSLPKLIFIGSLLYYNLNQVTQFFINFSIRNYIIALFPLNKQNNPLIPLFSFFIFEFFPLYVIISLIILIKYKGGYLNQLKEKWFLLDLLIASILGCMIGIFVYSFFINPFLHSVSTTGVTDGIIFLPNISYSLVSLLIQSISNGLDFLFLVFFAYFINLNSYKVTKNDEKRNYKDIIIYLIIFVFTIINLIPYQSYVFLFTNTASLVFNFIITYPLIGLFIGLILPGALLYFLITKFGIFSNTITFKKTSIILVLVFIAGIIDYILFILPNTRAYIITGNIVNYIWFEYTINDLNSIIETFAFWLSIIYILKLQSGYNISKSLKKDSNYVRYESFLSKFKKEKKSKVVINEADRYLEKIETIIQENAQQKEDP